MISLKDLLYDLKYLSSHILKLCSLKQELKENEDAFPAKAMFDLAKQLHWPVGDLDFQTTTPAGDPKTLYGIRSIIERYVPNLRCI